MKLETTPQPRTNQRRRTGARRAVVLGVLSLLIFAACQWLFVFGPGNRVRRLIQDIELNIYDSRGASLPRRKPDPRIVIVGLDDETLEHLPELDRPYYPLPRKYHAKLVRELFAAGAKVIGYDVMFALAQPDRDDDPAFVRELKRHGHVISALIPDTSLDDGVERATFMLPAESLRPYLFPASILVPQPVRWIDPWRVDDDVPGVRWPHFGFALAASYYRDLATTPTMRDTFHWGARIDAPLANGEDVLVRYAGPAGTFKPIPFYQVYDGSWRRTHPTNFFRGKIVVIGRISDLEDVHQTPAGNTPMPGVEVLANIAQMVLTHDYLRQATAETGIEATFVLILVYLLVLYRYSLIPAAAVAVVLSLGWAMVVTPIALTRYGIWVETVEPLVPLAMVVAAASLYEARRMNDQFERFVPSWVAASVLSGRASGTEDTAVERPVTVIFCDVRNFTEIAERYPGQAAEILRRFFEEGDRLARLHGTELDKYVGDEIMLYFFDPPKRRMRDRGEPAAHPLRATRWALDMLAAAQRIDATGIAGKVGFRVGIGIATGLAREGLVGVKGRVQNTVIGDVVNTASRLQASTKDLNRPIVMNEATYSSVRGFIKVEPLGEILVKGKQEPIKVFGPVLAVADAREESQ